MKLCDNLIELGERLKGCGVCPKMVQSRIEVLGLENNSPVLFRGSHTPTFLFVGLAPGRAVEKMKDKTNIHMTAFMYGSGDILTRSLIEAGYLEDEVLITNCCNCSTPADNNFNSEDVSLCMRLWLENIIRLSKPKAIVVMGKIAQNWFDVYVGKDIIDNIKVFKIPHPAWVGYQPTENDNYLRRLTSIRESIINEEKNDKP